MKDCQRGGKDVTCMSAIVCFNITGRTAVPPAQEIGEPVKIIHCRWNMSEFPFSCTCFSPVFATHRICYFMHILQNLYIKDQKKITLWNMQVTNLQQIIFARKLQKIFDFGSIIMIYFSHCLCMFLSTLVGTVLKFPTSKKLSDYAMTTTSISIE